MSARGRGRSPLARSRSSRLAATAAALYLVATLTGCEEGAPSGPGEDELDLSRYVAIGNSLTAGFMNGALGLEGQSCSYPRLLAGQAGVGGTFTQPLVGAPGISEPGTNEGRIELLSLTPPTIERAAPAGVPLNPDQPGPYGNLGVPGALGAEALVARSRVTSLTDNPFFDFVLRGMGTWADQVADRDATFVTVWLGNNDVLGYVLSGGENADFPTPAGEFGSTYEALIGQLLVTTDRIVLLNVPPVTIVPYLTLVPNVVVDTATLEPIPGPGGDPVPLLGPDGPLEPDALVTFDAIERILEGDGIPVDMGGTGEPLPGSVILDAGEQAVARAAVAAYNQAISQTGALHGLSVVDIHGIVSDIDENGLVVGDETLTTGYLVGGLFSLDGVHPTCKGQGVIANALIDAIEARYGASFPRVSIAGLPGVTLTAAGGLVPATLPSRGLPRFLENRRSGN
ncbi:MAG TPA: SGNH/GDSL hydrolase family protein [Gemmatimonadota bacterium]|nr:SGNH/GDSL hydrolase family protein [Gemmatimonadota bacterium]